MAKRRREIPPCSKTYGFPIYCAAWVPLDRISAAAAAAAEAEEKEDKGEAAEGEEKEDKGNKGGGEGEPSASSQKDRLLAALGGGGGEGRSGVPNALVISESDQPVFRMGTDAEVPYRMDVHPGGEGILCSFPNGCRLFEWGFPESKESHKLALKSSEKKLSQLEVVGLQLAVVFNGEGSMLATGGEVDFFPPHTALSDGHLRVFKWPSLESILDQTDAHATVKDLHFSLNGKFLVSLGNSGPCRVWDLASSTAVASLPRQDGEVFGFCRFSLSADNNQILLITAMHGYQGKIVSWNTHLWKRIGSKKVVRDPISAFNVAADGKLLAIGTIEGSIMILNSDMQVQTMVKKEHLGLVTALVFSQDSRALMSASFDSSARVTPIESRKSSGLSTLLAVLVIILSILVYFMKLKGDPSRYSAIWKGRF